MTDHRWTPRESDVTRFEERQRPVRIDELGVETPALGSRDERVVRRAAPMGDDGELHAEIVRPERAPLGLDPVTQWCRSRYLAAAAPPRAAAFGTGSSR